MAKKKRVKFNLDSFALALFISRMPLLIELWKNKAPDIPFDKFCLSLWEEGKARQEKK